MNRIPEGICAMIERLREREFPVVETPQGPAYVGFAHPLVVKHIIATSVGYYRLPLRRRKMRKEKAP